MIEHELEIIEELHFPGYFLVVWEIAKFCRDNGILAQGRGSAANSAVCYALKITAVDAVYYNLMFERFLAPERGGAGHRHRHRVRPGCSAARARASSRECATSTPSADQSGLRVTTIVVRPGSGRPIESYVARPITSTPPMVVALKWAKSSGIRHGIRPGRRSRGCRRMPRPG